MKFEVPQIKSADFAIQLFNLISDSVLELRSESGKFPDRITFSGPLGKELHQFILEKGWDLKKFGLSFQESISNRITFDYSKPIDQIEDQNMVMDSLDGKTVGGIPGPETVQRILSKVVSAGFKIERQIRPKLEIKLIRK